MEHPNDSDIDGSMSNQEDDEDLHESDYNSEDEVAIRNSSSSNNNNNNNNSNGGGGGGNNSNGNSINNNNSNNNNLVDENSVNMLAANSALNSVLNQFNLEAMSRLKSEDLADQATEMLARIKQQQQQQHQQPSQPPQRQPQQMDFESERDDMDDLDLKPEERSQRDLMLAMQRQAAQMAAAAAAAGLPAAAHFANLAASVGNLSGIHLNSQAICQLNSALLASNSSPSTTSGSSNSGNSSSSPALQSIEPGKGYTYEEQFKQLYELSDEPKRKKFLDDLFSFMQKRGTPINRIPIMAKQVLDLYELYQLVVARGGLVEVINKKIWREITKGLNLPSSITSAAFTLRTQYMKYLYPYECEKEKLSSPEELQMAIDGNRREGRRSSYGQYPELTNSPPPPSLLGGKNHMFVHNNNNSSNNGLHSSPLSLVSRQINGHCSQGNSSGEEDNGSVSSNPPFHLTSTSSQNEALNLEINPRNDNPKHISQDRKTNYEDLFGVTPNKRFLSEENFLLNANFPSTHLKISSKDGRTLDNQLTVSMEINGILYHGILFAQTNRNNSKTMS